MSYNSKYTGAEVESLLDEVNMALEGNEDSRLATKDMVDESIKEAITTTLNTSV